MDRRGAIYNPGKASQPRDFSRLRYANKITPTDVDCLIEFGNEAYVIIEAKSNGQEVPYGQRLALQRMIRDFVLRGKVAVLIIATHNFPEGTPIDFAACRVIEHFDGKEWSTERRKSKTRQFVNTWLTDNGLSKFIPANT